MPAYAENGVRWLWLIDPAVQCLQVYENDGGSWKLENDFHADDSICAPPFAEVALAPSWA